MSSRTSNNKRSQGNSDRGRGRGGRNRKFERAKPVCAPKYEGPMVGSTAYLKQQGDREKHDFSEYDEVPQKFMPIKVNTDNERDGIIKVFSKR